MAALDEPSVNEQDWPAVPAAYDFVRPSYELVLRRLEAAEARARAVLTFAASVTFATPALAAAIGGATEKRSYGSWLFFFALLLFVLIAYWGWAATFDQRVQVVDPMRLYEQLLGIPELEFKRKMIYFAGDAFAANSRLTGRVSRLSEQMGIALLVEVAALFAWLAGF